MVNPRLNTKLGHWNVNGLYHQQTELENFIIEHDIDVMLVNETNLNKSKLNSMPGYQLIRHDRLDSTGGGLAIIIEKID